MERKGLKKLGKQSGTNTSVWNRVHRQKVAEGHLLAMKPGGKIRTGKQTNQFSIFTDVPRTDPAGLSRLSFTLSSHFQTLHLVVFPDTKFPHSPQKNKINNQLKIEQFLASAVYSLFLENTHH